MRQATSQLEAAGLALAGYALWVLCDVSLKLAGASHVPVLQVIALVGAGAAGLVLLQSRGQVRTLWPKRPGRQALRAMLDLGNNVSVLIALRHVSLAVFYLLIFLAPLVATMMARLLLHERLTVRQVVALLVGFVGVAVAVDPLHAGAAGDRLGYLACLVCVACFATNMVWSRRMTQTESAASMTFFSGLVIAAVAGVAMLPHVQPVPMREAVVISAIAVFGVLGNLCFFLALRHARTAFVSQFHYSQLPLGAAVGYWAFGERVSAGMVAGAVLITAAGIYTAMAAQTSAVHE